MSHALLPYEVIAVIDAIFRTKDEVKTMRDLRGDDAQAFIDAIDEVRSALLPF